MKLNSICYDRMVWWLFKVIFWNKCPRLWWRGEIIQSTPMGCWYLLGWGRDKRGCRHSCLVTDIFYILPDGFVKCSSSQNMFHLVKAQDTFLRHCDSRIHLLHPPIPIPLYTQSRILRGKKKSFPNSQWRQVCIRAKLWKMTWLFFST